MNESEHIAPVPPECDLRGLPWMPIDTVRLLDSDLFALATGEEFKAAVALWCKAWQQVPASSLPDDDRILAVLSGTGKRWPKVKAMALRGFRRCTDGRLYHEVIAEKAAEAWDHREEFLEKNNNATARQRRWRERQRSLSAQLHELGVTPPPGASLRDLERLLVDKLASTAPSTRDGLSMPLTGTGQGQERKGSASQIAPSPSASTPPDPSQVVEQIPLNDGTEYPVTKDFVAELDRLYPAVDPVQTLREMRGWCIGNPTRRKTSRGVRGFITSWFAREQDKHSKGPR